MTAKFIISLDFELGWGSIENSMWKIREERGVYVRLRKVFPRFLSELDALEVPVTWAFVGAMLEKPGDITLDHLPEELRQKTLRFCEAADPRSVDARDLFDQVLNSQVKHGLSSHTYSHVRFNHAGIGQRFIKSEMSLFGNVCKAYGIEVSTLVFPQNIEGFHQSLKDFNYTSVRTSANEKPGRGRLAHLVSSAFTPPPLSEITLMDNGLYRHSGSMFFNSGYNRPYRLPFIYRRAIKGLDIAIKNNGVVHYWIHPFNLAESSLMFPSLMKVLQYAAKRRDEGLLQIETFA